MMGLLNSLEVIAARPLPTQVKRWSWVPDADAASEKRWPWVPDHGVLPPYCQPNVAPMPVTAYRVAQAARAAERAAHNI
jgi:hypothetical protein